MAITASPVVNISISLIDRDRNTSTLRYHVPSGVALGALEGAVTDKLIPAIQGISDAVVTGYTISVGAEDPDAVLAPETSDVERKGVFSFRAADGSTYTVSVPSIKNTLVIDETNKINKADALVTTFINSVLDPSFLELDAIHPTTYLASDIKSLAKAEKHHRGSSRG